MDGNYFKGWYFKCCTADQTISFIPAYHRSNHKETASLQIITKNEAFHIPFPSLEYRKHPLSVKLGNCRFGEKGVDLEIQNHKLNLAGSLRFQCLTPICYDIMGPFTFVPFLQCRHRVYSMEHLINGQILLNGQEFLFQNGIGYLEGDCGRSFPREYLWTQCCFESGSLMLSVAEIPLFGMHFTGIVGIVFLNGKEYRIATYLGARIKQIGKNAVTVNQGGYQLTAKLLQKNAQPLCAPIDGKMNRTIHESASCRAYYFFSYQGKPLCEFTSDRASFEFEYP